MEVIYILKEFGICNNCGEPYYYSWIQRYEDYTRYRCNCGGDIRIENEILIKIEISDMLQKKNPEIYSQLIDELCNNNIQQ